MLYEFDPPPPSDVGALDFGTKTVNYSGRVVSNWVNFPFLAENTEFTVSGAGNPTAQTVSGSRGSEGLVRWGTNIEVDIPPVGETRVVEFSILGEVGTFTVIRE